ncbi:TetR/AcrR family transcriptional regulator [Sulfuriroseicoccus oceanibius]|uniref:TetR/AcrR family transcriptional regulator n=1 Tax=Sulfuriroseicoccus oceanibius TaxID=2707525 RepID=A0A6B3L1J3_9BACT|nr:TetR/AcrR family transcriptional regulator [Sulfuriroseicoccus oceanibius]QQL43906.1 TetR/AcrR family transcriptional regulator [Sulfuriroseicoccus oceanibius]
MSPTAPSESPDARNRILQVAEEAFAAHGFDRPSLRDITSKAKVNLASVSYYFGSRDGLVDAVILRAIRRWNERRVELLEDAEKAAEKEQRKLTLHEIVAALVDPLLETGNDREPSTEFLGSVLSRSFGSGDRDFPAEMRPAYDEVSERFAKALGETVPHLAEREIFWRVFFGIGGLFRIFSHGQLFTDAFGDRSGGMEKDLVRRQLIAFIVGGMQAPSVEAQD